MRTVILALLVSHQTLLVHGDEFSFDHAFRKFQDYLERQKGSMDNVAQNKVNSTQQKSDRVGVALGVEDEEVQEMEEEEVQEMEEEEGDILSDLHFLRKP